MLQTIPYEAEAAFAQKMDDQDPLKKFRERFHFPKDENENPLIYFCGNSLGLQPKSVKEYVRKELEDWAKLGVKGHVDAKNPWLYYHHFSREQAAKVVGAHFEEVVMMNTLTVNLHLLMVSFYQPKEKRFKILMEDAAFSSDTYAVESQVRYHGFDPEEAIIYLKPKNGAFALETEDIIAAIEEHQDQLALVMLGGVNYYTGQFFEIEKITEAGHGAGAKVGWDMAHAAGNVELELSRWNVDFAAWCTYKYLNSGPGGVGGVFVHEKHGNNPEIPRFAGWWGYDEDTRFEMKKGFQPIAGAAGWQLSNAQILPMAAHMASLDIFDEAGMDNLRAKSVLLTGFLEFLLHDLQHKNERVKENLQIITPSDPEQRGCQLSLLFQQNGKDVFNKLGEAGVVADWRQPNVIRIAPVPLYNTFSDVFNFYNKLKEII